MLKTKLNLTVASALMVGGMVAVLSTSVQAAPVTVLNTTLQMYDSTGAVMGSPDNTVTMTYDKTAMTWGASSSQSFFGNVWTASGGVLYNPGTYNVNINGDGSNEAAFNASYPLANGDGIYTFTVPAGHYGGNINFAWGTTTGIDVFIVWSTDGITSIDVDGDSIRGAKMVDGPFAGASANFSNGPAYVVPVPAAAWLFGSGLLGLVGVARRRNKAAA
jgi:hypothetical protein